MGQNPVDSPLCELRANGFCDRTKPSLGKILEAVTSIAKTPWKLALGLVLFSEQRSFLESPGFL